MISGIPGIDFGSHPDGQQVGNPFQDRILGIIPIRNQRLTPSHRVIANQRHWTGFPSEAD
jgi:hypothetical protein